jgi:hypothetical protein
MHFQGGQIRISSSQSSHGQYLEKNSKNKAVAPNTAATAQSINKSIVSKCRSGLRGGFMS